jgi:hypothetical protein
MMTSIRVSPNGRLVLVDFGSLGTEGFDYVRADGSSVDIEVADSTAVDEDSRLDPYQRLPSSLICLYIS